MLGPHGISNRWSSAGTSCHVRRTRIAGHTASTVMASYGEAAWRRVRAPPPAPTNLVIDQRLHVTGQPGGHHGATPRRPAQRRSAGNWRSSVPLHSSACPPPVALPQAPAVAGGTRRRPAAGKATAPGDHFPGPFACTGAGHGGPGQAVKDGAGQATGPGGRADRLCHPGSLRHSMGMRRPLLGPPGGGCPPNCQGWAAHPWFEPGNWTVLSVREP